MNEALEAFIWIVILVFFHEWPLVPQAWYNESQLRSNSIFLWSSICNFGQAFSCVEMFAGDGNVSKSMRYGGMVACAALDIRYSKDLMRVHQQNAFDLGSPAGLA